MHAKIVETKISNTCEIFLFTFCLQFSTNFDFQVSQDSVATRFKVWWEKYMNFVQCRVLFPAVEEFLKSVQI